MCTSLDSLYLSHTAIQQHQQHQTSFHSRFCSYKNAAPCKVFAKCSLTGKRFFGFDTNGLNSLTAYKNFISLVLVC